MRRSAQRQGPDADSYSVSLEAAGKPCVIPSCRVRCWNGVQDEAGKLARNVSRTLLGAKVFHASQWTVTAMNPFLQLVACVPQ